MTQAEPSRTLGLTRPLALIFDPDISVQTDPAKLNICIDRKGSLPDIDASRFDSLVTIAANAPAPWVTCHEGRLRDTLRKIEQTVAASPVAATILAEVLSISGGLPFERAVRVESLAYSTLLRGEEFAGWLEQRPEMQDAAGAEPVDPIEYIRDEDLVTLRLSSPGTRNAMTARMRDSLHAALTSVLEDPSNPRLMLEGQGKCFSIGGFLPEFGSASDVALAHLVRTHRNCAVLLHRLAGRAEVRMHGACIGSGLEISAAVGRRCGTANSFFQLPELTMGLIPGAGGTVTVPKAIGRHRAMWMLLTGARVTARDALAWGLIHEIVE